MLSIRFYNEEDYDGLKETLLEGNLFDKVWETKLNLKNKIKRDEKSIIIAEDNNKVVGCIFIMEDGRNAFIRRLAVRKNYREKGIGQKLIQKAEQIIKSRGLKEIGGFVDSGNTKLQKWYEKQNYKKGSNFNFIYKNLV